MPIKIKLGHLLNPDLMSVNEELNKLLTFNCKNAGLRYDTQIKLRKAVIKELEYFNEARIKLCEVLAAVTELGEGDNKRTTKMAVIEVEGKNVEQNYYNIPEEKQEELNKSINELLNNEVELNCFPISITKLEAEEDTSELNFIYLEPFLIDDREKKNK